MPNLKSWFIALINILLANFVESIKTIQLFALEDDIPFRSDIVPPIHRIERSLLTKFPSNNNYNETFSRHRVTIHFFHCQNFRNWLPNEEIIIKIMQTSNTTFFQATFGVKSLPEMGKNLGCTLLLDLNLFLVFDNCLLIILYRLKNKEAVENSYSIHFTRNKLYFDLQKSIYYVNEKAILRCYVLYPDELFHRKNYKIEIGGTGRGYVVINKQRFQNNLVLELTVQFVQVVDSIIFTCSCDNATIQQIVNVLDPSKKEDSLIITFINRTSLAICIGILVIVLIIIGIYLLIIGRKRRLSTDIVAYYTELVEDDIVRLPDPILHKLTSPLRKFPLPGILNRFQLRRNFQNLFKSFSKKKELKDESKTSPDEKTKLFGKGKDSEENMKDDKSIRSRESQNKKAVLKKPVKKTNKSFLKSLQLKNVITLGPPAQPTPIIPFNKSSDKLSPLTKVSSESVLVVKEKEPVAPETQDDKNVQVNEENKEYLQTGGISSLPYVQIMRVKPFWSLEKKENPKDNVPDA